MSQGLLAEQRLFCRAQCKEKKEKVDGDNIKEWTVMDFASSTRAAEDRTRWKGVVVKSSVVPQRHHKVICYTCTRLDYPYLLDNHRRRPGLATYFRFTFRFFKKGSCQLLAKVCARSTG